MAVRWMSFSTQFLADPKIEELGERHGPAGPLLIVGLLGRAKIAADGGRVSCSFRTLAHEAFTDRETAQAIIETAAEVGLIEVESATVAEVSARFPAFARWQEAGRKAEERRVSKPADRANVRTRPEVSGLVPTDRQTEKTEREEKKERKSTSGKPSDFDSWLAHYRQVTGRESIRGSKPARTAFAARRRDGYTLDDLRAATVGCHGDQFCRDNGHDVPETILRASKVDRYIALAKQGPRSTSSPGMAQAERRAAAIRAKQERAAA